MHAFCALKMQPKLLFCPNVKACAMSLHHEDFAHTLTCGWFGHVFSQKMCFLFLADPILTTYNVGIV